MAEIVEIVYLIKKRPKVAGTFFPMNFMASRSVDLF